MSILFDNLVVALHQFVMVRENRVASTLLRGGYVTRPLQSPLNGFVIETRVSGSLAAILLILQSPLNGFVVETRADQERILRTILTEPAQRLRY